MPEVTLNKLIQDEIARLVENYSIGSDVLEEFASFVIANHKTKVGKTKKKLTINELKEAVYSHFGVKSTAELKKSGSFKMAIDGMEKLNFSSKDTWELLHRKFVGVLPNEENQKGYGCINGINIFEYFKPWQVFGLDPQKSTTEDVKKSYYNLSKIYHPDTPDTGDSKIFDRITTMYKSITAGA